MKKHLLLISSICFTHCIHAQVTPGGVQKNIEQSLDQIPLRSNKIKPIANVDVLELEKTESIDNLTGIKVQGNFHVKEINNYWKNYINKPVSSDELRSFNGWLFAEARLAGYLSYSKTQILKEKNGEVLEITIVQPRLNAVRMNTSESDLLKKYGELVLKRLQNNLKAGDRIDTLGLDQSLDSAGYDLPIELDATIRAVADESVDLVINLNPAPHEPGKVLQALSQINNYGLKAYGVPQLLGSITLQGHEPKASLNLTAQKSEGVTYGRAEYETAVYGSGHRIRTWASSSASRSILGGSAASKGETLEFGIGAASIFDGYRDFVFKENVEAVVRHTVSSLQSTGVTLSRIHDQQFRMRTIVDNEKLSIDSSRIEYNFTVGSYSLLDGITSVQSGGYAKIELGLKHQTSWSLDRTLYSLVRFRGQLSSDRLDTYNQFSLGGVAGVRAYTTVDGVGDNGGVLSLELNKRMDNGMTAGVFYDGGRIKLLNPQSVEYRQSYSLQAVGAQLVGNYANLIYNLSLAKGIGGYKGWTGSTYNIESKPNNWRLNVALTYLY